MIFDDSSRFILLKKVILQNVIVFTLSTGVFEKGFIRAETVSYEDFVENEGWVNSKTNGKMRLEGKDYIVKDGDVLNFRFNT